MSTPSPTTTPASTPVNTIIPQRIVWQPSSNRKISDEMPPPAVLNARIYRGSPRSRNLAIRLNKMLTQYNELDVSSMVLRAIHRQMHEIDRNIAELEDKAYRLDCYTKQLKSCINDLYDTKLKEKTSFLDSYTKQLKSHIKDMYDNK